MRLAGYLGWVRSRGAVALAVVALALRVAIPAGYMIAPAAEAGQAPQMVICTGQGAMTVAVADSEKTPTKAPAKTADHPCAFAAGGVSVPAPATGDLVGPTLVAYTAEIAPLAVGQRPGLGLAAPPPPKTGPPAIL